MTLDPKQKKAILGVGIAICLLISGTKLYSFYKSLQPPFEVGECFSITDPRVGEVKFQVVENEKSSKSTFAIGEVDLGFAKIKVPVKASYDEIRESGAKKVDCE